MNAFRRCNRSIQSNNVAGPRCEWGIGLASLLFLSLGGHAQEPRAEGPAGKPAETAAARAEALAEVTRVQQAFLQRVHGLGFSCFLAVPRILVEDIPSYGQYDSATNTLRTSDWSLLSPEERRFAYAIAGPGTDEAAARATFNEVAHHWIFVHEMGHWWQACRKVSEARKPYELEYEADRIDAAYWNEAEPALTAKMIRIAQSVLDHAPNPVPDGQEVQTYFDAHYQTLGPSPAYPWFQARMIVDSGHETPKPTLAQALAIN